MSFTRADKGSAGKKQFLRLRKKCFFALPGLTPAIPEEKMCFIFQGEGEKKSEPEKLSLRFTRAVQREREYSKNSPQARVL